MSKFFDAAQQTKESTPFNPDRAEIDIATLLPSGDMHPLADDAFVRSDVENLLSGRNYSFARGPAGEAAVEQRPPAEFIFSAQTPPFPTAEPNLQAAMESYRVLRTRISSIQATRGIRSVVIASSLQGEGKTLTLVNLARCRAQLQDTPVLMID